MILYLGQVYSTIETAGETLEGYSMLSDLLKIYSLLHILHKLNDFNGVLSIVLRHLHLIEFLEAALDLSQLRN